MKDQMRIMSAKPLNAGAPIESLRSWITPNTVFFDPNRGEIPPRRIPLTQWRRLLEGEVERPAGFTFEQIRRMPKAIVADVPECSGYGRSLLAEKAAGNPWTVGGVGNAVWGGVYLKSIFTQPLPDETVPAGSLVVLGTACAGEEMVERGGGPGGRRGRLETRTVHRA